MLGNFPEKFQMGKEGLYDVFIIRKREAGDSGPGWVLIIELKSDRLHLVDEKVVVKSSRSTPWRSKNVEDFQSNMIRQRHTATRAGLIRHYTEDIPDVNLYEISLALTQLKNKKVPGDRLTAELLKADGKPGLKYFQRLFDSVLHQGQTSLAWSRGVVVLFLNKSDNNGLLKNCRSILLLTHVHKLFSRVITNHLHVSFDEFQPREQADIEQGFIVINHIHTPGYTI